MEPVRTAERSWLFVLNDGVISVYGVGSPAAAPAGEASGFSKIVWVKPPAKTSLMAEGS